MPLLPMMTERKAGQPYVVLNTLVESLEDELNEWAEKGYYTASAPQVYMNPILYEGQAAPFVVQILEYDEHRWKLEGGKP